MQADNGVSPGSVLVATDLSPGAAAGLDWAVELSRGTGRRLVLVHAQVPNAGPSDYSPTVPDLLQDVDGAARERLESLCAELGSRGVDCAFEVRPGRPSDAILDAVAAHRPELIVVASRGLAGLEHALLGSTTERIVRHASCPVLTVRGAGDRQIGPFRRILIATDFGDEATAAARAVVGLLDPNGSSIREISLIHVYEVPYDLGPGGLATSAAAGSELCETTRCHVLVRLEAAAAALRPEGVEVAIEAVEGRAAEAILRLAGAGDFDAIAMGTHGRTGLRHALLGSVAERVVRFAPCPVLTLRREAVAQIGTGQAPRG